MCVTRTPGHAAAAVNYHFSSIVTQAWSGWGACPCVCIKRAGSACLQQATPSSHGPATTEFGSAGNDTAGGGVRHRGVQPLVLHAVARLVMLQYVFGTVAHVQVCSTCDSLHKGVNCSSSVPA
ncbi:hypothetical protein COO60DRAFT_1699975 [Scenedesmus sp. NREL 46B-D3]|nr:hypothetical protein COO60DRAFT_1699975 [Scenedesmus sp. NREL 46B-D3]